MKNFLERGSDFKTPTNSCKFYVSVDQELQDLNKSVEEIDLEKSKPKLLDGEIIITEGNRVLFFPNFSDKTKGLLGNLYVTNFRFLFDAYEEDNSSEVENLHQRNYLVGEHGACLTNVESLYQLLGEKKRKLSQDSQLTEKIKGLQIVCKTMKVFTFNFDQSPITQGKSIAKTLLHHAFPGRHQLLFAYDYNNSKGKPGKHPEGVVLFSERNEWENELTRTCSPFASNWRISTQNQRFQMSTSLPKWLIVPHSVLDCDFVTASQSFRCNRPPIWTWSSPNGAALVRMADLLPTITDRTQENKMLENIRKCHPNLKGPCIKYLEKSLPSISDLFQSYSKLRDLCMPENHRQFKLQDSHLYSSLENTKWLQYVSACLKVVVDSAQEIQQGTTVVLQESDGRDMSAVISSLVQLVLDSHSRSVVGFQSLVQKEWIALGHPFCRRLGHVKTNNSEQSPVFLFFLDCVWQLQNQFPSSFEFTETYLTTLWDSAHVSIFDTFLFDCEKDRLDAFMVLAHKNFAKKFNSFHEEISVAVIDPLLPSIQKEFGKIEENKAFGLSPYIRATVISTTERLQPRSVWNWSFQFSERDVELFINPLYKISQFENLSFGKSSGWGNTNSVILPEPSLPSIELWMQCYFRWLPVLSIKSGGRPQVDIVHRQLLKDIQSLLNDRGNLKTVGQCVSTSGNNSNSNNNTNNNNSNSNNNNSNNNNNNNNNSNNHRNNSNNHNNNSMNGNTSTKIVRPNAGKDNIVYYGVSNKSGSSSSPENFSDLNRVTLRDSSIDRFYGSDVETLFKNKGIIDNFFPFVIRSTPLASNVLANSSNVSEFDTQSVLNLTD